MKEVQKSTNEVQKSMKKKSQIDRTFLTKQASANLCYANVFPCKMRSHNLQIEKNEQQNLFKDMGFIKFWIISAIFWFSFPLSLAVSYVALGSVRTRQLVKALVHDFLQTFFIIIVVMCVVILGLYKYASGLLLNAA